MSRLIIISNRLPVSITKEDGAYIFEQSTGGLATGLGSFHDQHQSIWVGWPGDMLDDEEDCKSIRKKLRRKNLFPVFLSEEDYKNYYEGFSNNTLWPLFHYFWANTEYNRETWESYVKVNQQFCDEVIKIAKPGDKLWVQDYQLLLLPEMLRKELPDATIGFFLHIPFPSFELFRTLPWRKEILSGLMGADVIGFHTFDYVRHFLSSISQILDCDHSLGRIQYGDRIVDVEALPMGIDFDKFVAATEDPSTLEEIKSFKKSIGNQKLMLSVDRLDYSKGILQRLDAFEKLLDDFPEYREVVSLITVVVPSRSGVPLYHNLKIQIDEIVGRINGKYSTIAWTPIHYFYRAIKFETLVAFYSLSDIAVITPFRDGMNLVAKEYLASKPGKKGVLILSEMAGAAKELTSAVFINPNDVQSIITAFITAINMPEEEQNQRVLKMQNTLKRYNVTRWAEKFINHMDEARNNTINLRKKQLRAEDIQVIQDRYLQADKRLFLLDYDGTLVKFSDYPRLAVPSKSLLNILKKLASDTRNTVVIISGRDKYSLQDWFGNLKLDLIAEHGVWLKKQGKTWRSTLEDDPEWKPAIAAILEPFVERTAGSFIEDKDFSLVWHYRNSDPELGKIRSRELIDKLAHVISNYQLQILEGNKVIEIKNIEINKGKASKEWIANDNYNFCLAIGDDYTDEDIFKVLDEDHFSIKVGFADSLARYQLDSVDSVHEFLRKFLSVHLRKKNEITTDEPEPEPEKGY